MNCRPLTILLAMTGALVGCVTGGPLVGVEVVNKSCSKVVEVYIAQTSDDVRPSVDDFSTIDWGEDLMLHYGQRLAPLAHGEFRGINIPLRNRFERRHVYVRVLDDRSDGKYAMIGFPAKAGEWYVLSYEGEKLILKQTP